MLQKDDGPDRSIASVLWLKPLFLLFPRASSAATQNQKWHTSIFQRKLPFWKSRTRYWGGTGMWVQFRFSIRRINHGRTTIEDSWLPPAQQAVESKCSRRLLMDTKWRVWLYRSLSRSSIAHSRAMAKIT